MSFITSVIFCRLFDFSVNEGLMVYQTFLLLETLATFKLLKNIVLLETLLIFKLLKNLFIVRNIVDIYRISSNSRPPLI